MPWENAAEVDRQLYAADLTQLELDIEREERARMKAVGPFIPSKLIPVRVQSPRAYAKARAAEAAWKAQVEAQVKAQSDAEAAKPRYIDTYPEDRKLKERMFGMGEKPKSEPKPEIKTGFDFVQAESENKEVSLVKSIMLQFVKDGYQNIPSWVELSRGMRDLILEDGCGDKDIVAIAKDAARKNGMVKKRDLVQEAKDKAVYEARQEAKAKAAQEAKDRAKSERLAAQDAEIKAVHERIAAEKAAKTPDEQTRDRAISERLAARYRAIKAAQERGDDTLRMGAVSNSKVDPMCAKMAARSGA